MTIETAEHETDELLRLRAAFVACFGPILMGEALRNALDLPSDDALRQAKRRGRLGVHVFRPEGRRQLCALTEEVADWYFMQRGSVTMPAP